MTQKRKLRDENDSEGEGKLSNANHNGRRPNPKRKMSHIPNESSSNWFKTALPAEVGEETESGLERGPGTEDPGTSLAIGELQKPDGGVIRGSVDYTERSERPGNIDLDQALYSPPSKCEQTNLEMEDSESEIQSDEDSEKSCNYFNPPVEPARKIYLAPDRYAEYIAKGEREERLKRRNGDEKRKPWEQRSMHERGPRAGRSDEFLTKEEAQYAESIIRAARRHRLETWHRERHEMWGLKAIEVPSRVRKEMVDLGEDEEGDSAEEDMQLERELDRSGASNSGLDTLLKAVSIRRNDMGGDATIEEILREIPNPFDPCFNTPADTIFLPRIPKFTEVVFSLEYHLGYTRNQVRWLMGGARPGCGAVPSTNTIGMRLQRYMRKNGLTDAVKVPPTRTVERSKTPRTSEAFTTNSRNDDHKGSNGEAEQASHLLPHGPRIRRPEFGVHGWVWDHPHEKPAQA
ncbi:hypothetical protein B9Z19DRAFT_1125022 [Tuber borchii]|uniref:Uncharacterized protein n=1 Tax=Tuber borchii TaxID=42251 RepID=A0A2T6ZVM8_TUBBO|nr:hypothetical protein B9Z19DRAFT_1125022 [Tuber borchii]